MAIGLPFHEDPNTRVFGIIGQLSESDNGKTYIKVSDDTLNVGWQDVVPTTTTSGPTTTTTSAPTTTTTSGPTTTTSAPTTTTSAPTTTTTASPTARKFNISPSVSGKSVWDLDVDGPVTLSYSGGSPASWTISPYSSVIFVNFDINGPAGGKGGRDSVYLGGAAGSGSRFIGTFLLNEEFIVYPGSRGIDGQDYATGGGGGPYGVGFFSGGNGGDAGPNGFSGGGGGGGGTSTIVRSSNQFSPVLNVDIFIAGGGAGGGGAGLYSSGGNASHSNYVPSLSSGGDGNSNGDDGGGGGGGGGAGGAGGNITIGDNGADAGTNGGGNAGASLSNGDGYIYLY